MKITKPVVLIGFLTIFIVTVIPVNSTGIINHTVVIKNNFETQIIFSYQNGEYKDVVEIESNQLATITIDTNYYLLYGISTENFVSNTYKIDEFSDDPTWIIVPDDLTSGGIGEVYGKSKGTQIDTMLLIIILIVITATIIIIMALRYISNMEKSDLYKYAKKWSKMEKERKKKKK